MADETVSAVLRYIGAGEMEVVLTNEDAFRAIVLGISALVVVLLWMIYWIYRIRALEREERRLMIEKGMVPPPPPPPNRGWPGVRTREMELRFEERRLLIEKGLQPGSENVGNVLSELQQKNGEGSPDRYLSRGLKALAFGLGLAVAVVIFRTSGIDASQETQYWFLFFAVISPLIAFYGVANLVHYQLTKDKPRRRATTAPDQVR